MQQGSHFEIIISLKINCYVEISLKGVKLELHWICSPKHGWLPLFLTNRFHTSSHLFMHVEVTYAQLIMKSHPSHVLQPIDVACFKLFKTTFRFSMDVWTLANKGKNVRKEDLAQWVSLIFGKTLNPPNICKGFKSIRI